MIEAVGFSATGLFFLQSLVDWNAENHHSLVW